MNNDQAKKLRSLVKQSKECLITIISSSDDYMGKTTITTNLANIISQNRKKTLLIDFGTGLLTTDVLLDIVPKHGLGKLISGNYVIDDVAINVNEYLKVMCGKSLITEMKSNEKSIINIQDYFKELEKDFDHILIDANKVHIPYIFKIFEEKFRLVLISTLDDADCLKRIYMMLKELSCNTELKDIGLILNKVEDHDMADNAYNKLLEVTKKFLPINISKIGYISKDNLIPESIKRKTFITALCENSTIREEFKYVMSKMEITQ